MDTLLNDARYALRMAFRNKGFTLAAVLTLALGIGAATAVFSVVHGVLLRPLPYPDSDRLVRLFEERPGAIAPLRDRFLNSATYRAWLEREPRTLEGIAAYREQEDIVAFEQGPVRLPGAAVSPELFSLLRATPEAGQFFREDAEKTGTESTVVVSERLWRQRFASDPNVLGRTLLIDNRPHTIIGVAQQGFYFPDRRALLWTPYAVSIPDGQGDMRKDSPILAIGRLKTAATPPQAAAEGTAAARAAGQSLSADLLFGKGAPPIVHAQLLIDDVTASVRPALQVIGIGVMLILVVACANVANLLLSRGVARQQEFSVRAALGANRARLIQQLLTENLLLAVSGGAIGLLLGWAGVVAAPALAPVDFPRLDDIHMDFAVVAFAVVASLISAIFTGLVPALRSPEFHVSASVHVGDWGSITGSSRANSRRTRNGLLIAEAALAVLLLIGASLLGRSFVHLIDVNPGYDATRVLTARIFVPSGFASPERSAQILEAVLNRLRSMPAVSAAGGGNMMPLGESSFLSGFEMPSRDSGKPVMAQVLEYAVTPGYAEALGLQLRQGRLLNDQDVASATSAVLVNEEFARLYLPSARIVGRRYPTGLGSSGKVAEVVGVVGNVLKDGLTAKPQPEIYLALQNGMPMREINLLVRTKDDPMAVASAVRTFVAEEEPSAAVAEVAPLNRLLSASVAQPRFATVVLGTFAILALLLAGGGLYAVLSYAVSQRRREFGVRAALGAGRSELVRLVLREGMSVTFIGLAIGLTAAALLTRFLQGVLFGVSPLDGVTFTAAPILLVGVAMAACIGPARRAARVDPAEVLRST
jgi:predicted permease